MAKTWKSLHLIEFEKPYFKKLKTFLKEEIQQGKVIYPHHDNLFKAFELSSFDKTKVVILGQDPYHGESQAQGLSFSVPTDFKVPPSLKNIYKELSTDLNVKQPLQGNLESWAEQGVLLLNSTLSVRAHSPASHANQGWEIFTDQMIQALSEHKEHLVFMLWGKYAQSKEALIDGNKHLVLKAAHPSPFSAYNGFFGCQHFSKTNEFLLKNDKNPINWEV